MAQAKGVCMAGSFSLLVEIESVDPTHYNGVEQHTSKIDRIFTSLPGHYLTCLQTEVRVVDMPESLEQKGISDHAPLLVHLRHREPPGADERPIAKQFFSATEV